MLQGWSAKRMSRAELYLTKLDVLTARATTTKLGRAIGFPSALIGGFFEGTPPPALCRSCCYSLLSKGALQDTLP